MRLIPLQMHHQLFGWVSRLGAVQRTFVGACWLLVALELWRPCFFLTDDNLSGWLPVLVGIGHRVWSGGSLAAEPHLFGGSFNLLHDPNGLFYWNPLTFLLSPLANTRFYFLLADATAIVHILVGATAFSYLLVCVRRWYDLTLSSNRIVFLSLSFIFSQYSLTVGASWVTFLANQAALPLLLLGMLHPRRSTGFALGTVGFLYTLSMGHLSPFLFTLVFFGVFAFLWGRAQRSFEPVLRFGAALLVAGLLFSPLLFQAARGFGATSRSAAMPLSETTHGSIAPATLVASFFGGSFGALLCAAASLQKLSNFEVYASCAGGLSTFSTWRARSKAARQLADARTATPALKTSVALQDIAVAMMLLVALFVMRPLWLAQLLHALPLLRSLRWPFREIFVLLFWVHLWLALRPTHTSPRVSFALNCVGVAAFVMSLATATIWSFAPMRVDRNLVMSGQAQSYWQKLAPRFGPKDQFIAIVDSPLSPDRFDIMPFSLLGAYNYPALFGVQSASGYTVKGMANIQLDGRVPNHWSGTFSRADGNALLAKYPHLKALELVSLEPVRIDFRQGQRREHLSLPPLNSRFPAR